jgi:hypothetical protein
MNVVRAVLVSKDKPAAVGLQVKHDMSLYDPNGEWGHFGGVKGACM